MSKLELTGGITLVYSARSGISAVYLLRLSDEPLELLGLTGGPGTNSYIMDSLPDDHSFGECDSKFAKSSKYVVDPDSAPKVEIWSTFSAWGSAAETPFLIGHKIVAFSEPIVFEVGGLPPSTL